MGGIVSAMSPRLAPALIPLAALALAALCGPVRAQVPPFDRAPGETALAFAERALVLVGGDEETHVVEARWNGRPAVFADFTQRGADGDDERALVALMRRPDGLYDRALVTIGEQEGGEPEVIAIGFANADRDSADELAVMLRWPVQHLDVSGSLYEVRIFDDLKPGQARPAFLKSVSDRFAAHACDCGWSDGRRETYGFKTMALVKRELKRLGY